MLDFLWKSKPVLGVDIGSRTIKGVKLKKGKDGRLYLDGHFFQDLAQTSEEFPERCNREEAFKAAVEIQRLSSQPASTTVKDSDVISFSFSLPHMTEKELNEAVPQEVAEQAHIPIEEYICDYMSKKEETTEEIKAYCVKRDLIVQQMDTLKNAGLKPKAIEPEMMAVMSMLEFNDYIPKDQVVVVIDLGESRINTALISDGHLVITRTKDGAFGTINSVLFEMKSLSYDESEEIKNEYDFLSVPEDQSDPINQIMDEVFTDIFKNIKEILEFYKECPESFGRIDQILLMGGGSQIKNIDKIHEMFFKVPSVIVNPFRNIEILNSGQDQHNEEIVHLAPYMGTAVGLALSSFSELKKGGTP
jgi:type IV pilus assembly protein PilM